MTMPWASRSAECWWTGPRPNPQSGTPPAGDDGLDGDDGNDGLYGGAGADFLIGGAGFDYARYDDATAAVIGSLTNPASNTGDAAGESYYGIEGLVGSAFADTLIGDAGPNSLYGLAGNVATPYSEETATTASTGHRQRYLYGGTGGDVLDGASGFDFARYDVAGGPVRASLANAGVNSGEATGDSYSGIEALVGSAYADVLIGDSNGNILFGMDGNDVLFGSGGGHDYSSAGRVRTRSC